MKGIQGYWDLPPSSSSSSGNPFLHRATASELGAQCIDTHRNRNCAHAVEDYQAKILPRSNVVGYILLCVHFNHIGLAEIFSIAIIFDRIFNEASILHGFNTELARCDGLRQ